MTLSSGGGYRDVVRPIGAAIISALALFSAAIPASAGVNEIGITSGYSFDPYPAGDRGPSVGAHYCFYFLQDLGLKLSALARWDRPIQTDGKKADGLIPMLQSGAGLQYIVDIGTIDPYLGAGAGFFYGDLGKGNSWAFTGYIGIGVSYTIKESFKIGLELDYHYPFNAGESFPQFLMIQLELSYLFGAASDTLSRI